MLGWGQRASFVVGEATFVSFVGVRRLLRLSAFPTEMLLVVAATGVGVLPTFSAPVQHEWCLLGLRSGLARPSRRPLAVPRGVQCRRGDCGMCVEAKLLPSEALQDRFIWLRRCLSVDVVEGEVEAACSKRILEDSPSNESGWLVNQIGLGSLLEVGSWEEAAVEWAKAGYAIGGGALLRLRWWTDHLGTFPDPRLCCATIRLLGVPIVLCDELGMSSLVKRFGDCGV